MISNHGKCRGLMVDEPMLLGLRYKCINLAQHGAQDRIGHSMHACMHRLADQPLMISCSSSLKVPRLVKAPLEFRMITSGLFSPMNSYNGANGYHYWERRPTVNLDNKSGSRYIRYMHTFRDTYVHMHTQFAEKLTETLPTRQANRGISKGTRKSFQKRYYNVRLRTFSFSFFIPNAFSGSTAWARTTPSASK